MSRPPQLLGSLQWLLDWYAEEFRQTLASIREMERSGEDRKGSAQAMKDRFDYLHRIAAGKDARELMHAADSLLLAANSALRDGPRTNEARRAITEAQFQISDAITHVETKT